MQDYSGYGQPPTGDFGHTSPLPPMPPPPRPPRRRVGLLSYVAVALAAGALGAGTVVAVYHPASSSVAAVPQPSSSAVAPPAPQPSTAVPIPSSGGSSASGNLKSVEQGLVIINTTLQYSSEQAAGTGMVISAAGLVLTNNHVIENATKITATTATGQNYVARVVGYDVTGDIALIQLQNASGLHPVPIGDSSKLKTGDSVVALGNAQGQSQIVSAPGQVIGLNQTITASDQGGTVKTETLHGMIETNADVVAGDSGGSLVNSAGQVVGIDTAGNTVSSPQQSVSGYAIPIKTALSVASQIVAGHASSAIVIGYPPFIGIYVGSGTSSNPADQASQQQQQNNGFGNGGFGNGSGFGNGGSQSCYSSDANLSVPPTIASVNSGTLVLGTICNSPATAAGLTAGSVITSVNHQTIGSPQSLASVMSKLRPGDTVSVTWVTPNNQRQAANLSLTAGPPM